MLREKFGYTVTTAAGLDFGRRRPRAPRCEGKRERGGAALYGHPRCKEEILEGIRFCFAIDFST